MKRSKFVAVIVMVSLLAGVCQPAFASNGDDVAVWGFWGTIGGAVAGLAITCASGGTALPFIVGGAVLGGGAGMLVGSMDEDTRTMVAGLAVEAVVVASNLPEKSPATNNYGLINVNAKNSGNNSCNSWWFW